MIDDGVLTACIFPFGPLGPDILLWILELLGLLAIRRRFRRIAREDLLPFFLDELAELFGIPDRFLLLLVYMDSLNWLLLSLV
jgi:hypothetical protein